MSLGENVKFLRESMGLTFEAMEVASGIEKMTIFQLEKRKSKMSKFAPKLAEFFGVNVDALLSQDLRALAEQQQDASPTKRLALVRPAENDQGATDEIIELLALFQQANPRERENILDLARSIEKRAAVRWVRSGSN